MIGVWWQIFMWIRGINRISISDFTGWSDGVHRLGDGGLVYGTSCSTWVLIISSREISNFRFFVKLRILMLVILILILTCSLLLNFMNWQRWNYTLEWILLGLITHSGKGWLIIFSHTVVHRSCTARTFLITGLRGWPAMATASGSSTGTAKNLAMVWAGWLQIK